MRILAFSLLLALAAAAAAPAKTDQSDWPRITGVQRIAPNRDTTYVGTPRADKLLGGHGSDRLEGRGSRDVLWGDRNPSGQPETQYDTILGGDGDDFIYGSHGRNTIRAGAGRDYVKTHWGRGSVDCGPGRDVLYISRRAKPHYVIRNCETVSHRTLGY